MAIRIKPKYLKKLKRQTLVSEHLMKEHGASAITIRRWVRDNTPNGALTTKASLKILTQALNISEPELLETITQNATDKNRERNPPTVDPGQNS